MNSEKMNNQQNKINISHKIIDVIDEKVGDKVVDIQYDICPNGAVRNAVWNFPISSLRKDIKGRMYHKIWNYNFS